MWQGGGGGGLKAVKKKGISPSSPCHPHRPVAAVSREQLPVLAPRSHVSVDASIAGTLAGATRASRGKTRARDEDEDEERCGGGERGRGRLERLRDVPPLRDTAPLLCSLTCCLLLIIILFLYLSLQKHALLAPAAWQPLVSLTQLLCRLSHSQHSPTTSHHSSLTAAATPGQMRQHRQAIPPLLFLPGWFAFSEKKKKKKPDQNVTGIPQLGRDEKCCLAQLLPGKCCCKGIFGTAQHSIILQAWFHDVS